jgi:uncharacterized protein GlcG (DUF336 family)
MANDQGTALTAPRTVLTLEGAKRIAAAAEAEARRQGWAVCIAVVDESGNLIVFLRLDDTQSASNDIAIGKARTAAMWRRPTKAMEDAVAGGRAVVMTFRDATPVQGGLPLISGGRVVGGIGVSGVLSHQDEIVAKAGADILT